MSMILPSDCNACLRTLQVDRKQAVSLSQLLCTYYNKGSHMLSIVDKWGCIQYFFNFCFAIVTTSYFQSASWGCIDTQSPRKWSKVTLELQCTGIQHQTGEAFFSQWGFLPNHSMTACLIATDDVYVHHQCLKKNSLWNRFYACLIIIDNVETSTGMTMINGAAMPRRL